MKKIVMLSCVLGLIALKSQAQVKMEYGVKAGLNVSGLAISSYGKLDGFSYNNRTEFSLGGFATFRKRRVGLQPELVYSRQGQNFSTPYNSNLHLKLGYINVPVLLKYYLGEGFQVFAGPQIGFLASSKGDLIQISAGNIGQPNRDQNLSKYINSTDVALVIGFEIKFPKGLDLNIRYNSGLSNVNKYLRAQSFPNSLQPSVSTGYARNQVIQISVGYKLSKDKKK